MLELGQGTPATDDAELIKDVSEATFMQDVVEASQTTPIVVDFWAPWCGPCKTLGPQLEEAVRAAGGSVRMVKVNVDENQAIAGQLQIQSIPTVYAFWQGQPVDGFQGAVAGSEVTAFIDRLKGLAGDDGLADAVKAAEEMLEQGAIDDAAQTFEAIVSEDPKNVAAYAGMARCYLARNEADQAEAYLNGAPAEINAAPEIEAVFAQIALAQQAAEAGPVAELRAQVEANADDHQARFDLAGAYHASGQIEEAVEELLELFRRDREWNDGAAKAQMFTIFEALGPQDAVALNGRRKLSSMIFA